MDPVRPPQLTATMAQDFDEFDGTGLNLRDLIDVLSRRRALFFQAFAVILTIGVALTSLGKPVYRTSARLVAPTPPYQFNIMTDSTNPLTPIPMGTQGDSVDTQVQVMRSAAFQQEVVKRSGLAPGAPIPVIGVDPAGDGIIAITVEGANPDAIARVANQAVALHIENSNKRAQAGVEKAIVLLQQQLKSNRTRLQTVERKLNAFWAAHRTPVVKEQQEARARRQEDLLGRLQQLDARIATTDGELASLQSQMKAEPPVLLEVKSIPNPVVERVQKRLEELQIQKDDLLREFAPTSQKLARVNDEIRSCQERLSNLPPDRKVVEHPANPRYGVLSSRAADTGDSLRKDRIERSVLSHQLDAVRKEIAAAAVGDRSLDFEQGQLTDERNQAQANGKQLADKLRDLQLRLASAPTSARVLEKAVPPSVPVDTGRASRVLTAFISALLIAVIVIAIQEAVDDRINRPEDIAKLTPLPIMAHVPDIDAEGPPLLTTLPSHSPAGESYRALRFSLRLAMVDGPIRRVLITSPSESEGKSVTAVNLATVMALEGWRVVIIDADLRKPNLHRLLHLANDTGLSELLAGLSTVEAAIQETPVANLRAICSGPVPPNPSELLGGDGFRRLQERLCEVADVLIFDSPPCLPVTDPLVMSKEVEGVILVLDAAETRKTALRHALGSLERAGARVLGLVMNKISQRSGPYYYYYGRSEYYGVRDPKEGKGEARRVWAPRRHKTPKD